MFGCEDLLDLVVDLESCLNFPIFLSGVAFILRRCHVHQLEVQVLILGDFEGRLHYKLLGVEGFVI